MLLIILIAVSFISCTPKSKKIPLTDVWEHVKYQNEANAFEKRDEYEKLLKANPDSPEAYYLLSRCMRYTHQSRQILEKGISKFPENPYILAALGGYYIDANGPTTAQVYLEKAIKLNKMNPLTNYHLFRFYRISNDFALAQYYLETLSESEYHYLFINDNELISNQLNEENKLYEEKRKQDLLDARQEEMDSKKRRACMEMSSREMVDERLNILNYNTLGYPQLIAESNCRFSWYVNVINRNGFHSECVIITDGSTGKVEIIKVDCS